MKVTNKPVEEGKAVEFIVTGFPEEEAIRAAVGRFYQIKQSAGRNFTVHNEFDEVIFSGHTDSEGNVASFTVVDRRENKQTT